MIVPLAPGETMLQGCITELLRLGEAFELIVVSPDKHPEHLPERIRWLQANGRAAALNLGAAHASCDWLWFVHADSRLPEGVGQLLLDNIARYPERLLYFDLEYYDGGLLHKLSAWGAKWRSRLFRAPFGDQAFCVLRRFHQQVGGYSEKASYGEDHLYVRAMRRAGIGLTALPAKIGTSARNHLSKGWLNVVVRYQWMWIKQVLQDRNTQFG